MTSGDTWQFWIDVGGTFADCIARTPTGSLVTHKLLSTGAYPGKIGEGSAGMCIVDAERTREPKDFFCGYEIEIALPEGNFRSHVVRFIRTKGELHLSDRLPETLPVGARYELRSPEPAPVAGIRWLMGKRLDEPIGRVQVRLGTTRATNALLERRGARMAFVTTRGFSDVLRIGFQNRPRLFELRIRKPQDLYERVVELDERVSADGEILRAIEESEVRAKLSELRQQGIASLAVCFLHGYRNPVHELRVEQIARELGFTQISVSSRLSALPRIVPRGETSVVDAYLTPVLREYVDEIAACLPEADLQLMTSAGSLVSAAQFHGKDAVLSGPAGGVVGAAFVAKRLGLEKVIGFDMGGTSTDVSRFDGEYERRYEMEVADPKTGGTVRIVAPMLAVETVAAGGGSICWFDGQKPVVGPRSAGADPGPACYGRGGPLTITDVNLLLGRIVPDLFPFVLDISAVKHRIGELIREIELSTGKHYAPEELAEGFIAIANANMIAPIRRISIARGYDVRDYALVSFGGAGAQHACAIARELGMNRVLCSAHAGVLSALGMGVAEVTRFAECAIGRPSSEALADGTVEQVFAQMELQLRRELAVEGFTAGNIQPPRRLLEMRYTGQESRITVPCPKDDDYLREFTVLHRQLYGFTFPERAVEIYSARLELTAETSKPTFPTTPALERVIKPLRTHSLFFAGQYHTAQIYLREQLQPGDQIPGPAIIAEPIATIVVEPDWRATVNAQNEILLSVAASRQSAANLSADETPIFPKRLNSDSPLPKGEGQGEGEDNIISSTLVCLPTESSSALPDPIDLELFNNHFASIAEQMGAMLQKTSLSTNVKERLDFSCAIFTGNGDLVVNAPHIPVHLGAMSECVKCLREDMPAMRHGDVYVTNDPYRGGSHLPDVTVITPVFVYDSQSSAPQFFVASRAHHAEIGGITPGSMPPFSKTLAEEGVLIRHFALVRDGQSQESELRRILTEAPFPTRAVEENVADIQAQVGANQAGVRLLQEMIGRHGSTRVRQYMQHIQNAAEAKMRAALGRLAPGEYRFTDQLDDGSSIAIKITINHTERGGEAIVDFSGTGPVLPGNLNANRAIVTSALIYCFRCLIAEPIPLNSGVLAPIKLILPDNCLLNPPSHPDPAQCPAVVGGNVETSQRIVDVIFGALGIVAASQGTMNNFIFGRSGPKGFGYYETIAGGSGAGSDFDGADAVHTHMTNTRLTDPEVLELRYPARVLRCEIRRDSGGNGKDRGGNGLIREIEFLAPVEVSLLTSRRTSQPYGLDGGQAGKSGRNLIKRAGEAHFTELREATHLHAQAGDTLRIETPGGGGYGAPSNTRLYFAYGSNMPRDAMLSRCANAQFISTAVLRHFRFLINRRGYASMESSTTHNVHGVLWQITPQDEAALDEYEAVAEKLYRKEEVTIQTARGESVRALIYVASNNTPGHPLPGYLEEIIASARLSDFPSNYIEEIVSWRRQN